jgi:Uma2 family endonuclease
MLRKFNRCMKAGVREYWIVEPQSKTVRTFVLENGAYRGTIYDAGAALPSAVLEGLSISPNGVFAG